MIDSFSSNSLSDSNGLSDDPILDLLDLNSSDSDVDQDTIAAIAYSAPEAPLNPQLKPQLFRALGLQSPACDIYSLLNLSIQALQSQAATLPWEAIDIAPGFETAICQEDESSRTVACFIRADSSASFPNHTHASEEVIVVLGGDIFEEKQVYQIGDRVTSAPGSSHQLNTAQGCLLFCIASMDNQFE